MNLGLEHQTTIEEIRTTHNPSANHKVEITPLGPMPLGESTSSYSSDFIGGGNFMPIYPPFPIPTIAFDFKSGINMNRPKRDKGKQHIDQADSDHTIDAISTTSSPKAGFVHMQGDVDDASRSNRKDKALRNKQKSAKRIDAIRKCEGSTSEAALNTLGVLDGTAPIMPSKVPLSQNMSEQLDLINEMCDSHVSMVNEYMIECKDMMETFKELGRIIGAKNDAEGKKINMGFNNTFASPIITGKPKGSMIIFNGTCHQRRGVFCVDTRSERVARILDQLAVKLVDGPIDLDDLDDIFNRVDEFSHSFTAPKDDFALRNLLSKIDGEVKEPNIWQIRFKVTDVWFHTDTEVRNYPILTKRGKIVEPELAQLNQLNNIQFGLLARWFGSNSVRDFLGSDSDICPGMRYGFGFHTHRKHSPGWGRLVKGFFGTIKLPTGGCNATVELVQAVIPLNPYMGSPTFDPDVRSAIIRKEAAEWLSIPRKVLLRHLQFKMDENNIYSQLRSHVIRTALVSLPLMETAIMGRHVGDLAKNESTGGQIAARHAHAINASISENVEPVIADVNYFSLLIHAHAMAKCIDLKRSITSGFPKA
jgi:hypothetical protein